MSAYYTSKPIIKEIAAPAEESSKQRKNLILGLPIHSIEEKVFFGEKGDRPHTNYDTDSPLLTDGIYARPEDVLSRKRKGQHNSQGILQ